MGLTNKLISYTNPLINWVERVDLEDTANYNQAISIYAIYKRIPLFGLDFYMVLKYP